MGSVLCPYCDAQSPPGALHCANCGASLLPAPSLSSPSGARSAGSIASVPGTAFSGGPGQTETEVEGLRYIRSAAWLGLIGLILSSVPIFWAGAVTGAVTAQTPSGSLPLTTGLLDTFLVAGELGIVIDLVMYIFYRRGYACFQRIDNQYGTPGTLSLVAVIGTIIIGFGLLLFVSSIGQLVSCLNSSVSAPGAPCVGDLGPILGEGALMGVGAIILLVGLIGVMIGVWRLGERYQRTGLKIAAVLMFFPVLNVVASILVIMDTHAASERLHPLSPLDLRGL